jgi:hypothetical protein
MADNDLLNTPLLWVNKYLENKITQLGDFGRLPFFPSTPTSLDDLTEMFIQSPDGVMCVYDRLSRMNKNKFPHIKTEQILYYFYATAENTSVNMIKIQEAVLRLLDRGDESAEEVNNWCSNRKVQLDDGSTINNVFYFHTFKVYQLEEARDVVDFGTARTYGGNKFIIEFEYHPSPSLTGHDWTPELLAPGASKIII